MTMTFTHILLPLDGTAMAERVIPAVRGLADPNETRITLLHVIEQAAPARKHGERHLREAAAADAYLRDLAARAFAGFARVDCHMHGDAVHNLPASLLEHTQEFRPDLVAMCAHGHQWWKERLHGNLAQQLLHASARLAHHAAHVPVLLVQPDADGRVGFPFRRILVPLDGSDAHEQGLAPAAKLATRLGIPIVLFTAISADASVRGRRDAAAALLPRATEEVLRIAEEEAAVHLERHVRELRAAGVEASGRVVRVEPAAGIVATAAELGADLIVLGTHALSATSAFWAGSITPRILQKAHASFLLAPSADHDPASEGPPHS
jgi:nucleotide-binding universal stress UspA family protein